MDELTYGVDNHSLLIWGESLRLNRNVVDGVWNYSELIDYAPFRKIHILWTIREYLYNLCFLDGES
jgi:hypothetical protein